MEAGENPARARRRDARKAPFYPKPQFGDKPLAHAEKAERLSAEPEYLYGAPPDWEPRVPVQGGITA